jgi:glutamate synthase (ferredoxin)
VLSGHPRSFFDYFNQLFAQVTNPPIDALRESFVTSSVLYLGNHGNLLEDAARTAAHAPGDPILTKDEFERIATRRPPGLPRRVLLATYRATAGEGALEQALEPCARPSRRPCATGANILVALRPRGEGEVPIPSLLSSRPSTTT